MSRFQIKSKSTKYSVISTTRDAPGDVVRTASGESPPFSILNVHNDEPGKVTITGFKNLYVSLNGSSAGTKLTWSNKKYTWQIKATAEGSNYIIPGNGEDLFWFDSFQIGTYVIVKEGKDIIPPDSEWYLIPA